MKDVKIEEEFCRHPCKRLMYNLELMQEEQADYDVNWIDLKFAEMVVVKNEISNYDAFRLIVEVSILPCKLYEISGYYMKMDCHPYVFLANIYTCALANLLFK